MPSMKRTSSQEVKDTRILANRYKVQRKLGSGSFGTVFVVEDLKSDEIWLVPRLKCYHLFLFMTVFSISYAMWNI